MDEKIAENIDGDGEYELRGKKYLYSKNHNIQFIKDKKGLLYSTELLLSLILVIFIIGIIANISDSLNEKILSEEELSALEDISIETADYLLNNPGNPEDWESDEGLNRGIVSGNIIPGLALKDKSVENGFFISESSESEEILDNTISYMKLVKVKNNYDELINRNLFNNSFKSSIDIIPINSGMNAISMGDDLSEEKRNVIVVKRLVKMDYYNNFVIYRFNDFELYGKDYTRSESCNHDSNPSLKNHTNDGRSFWLCKNFRIYRSSLKNYNYYLISDESVKRTNSHYVLESVNRSNDDEKRMNNEIIDLNPYFTQDMENSSNDIYSIHFNVKKEDIDDFKTVLVAIPKNMTNEMISNNQLKYDYFNTNEVNFILKTAYN